MKTASLLSMILVATSFNFAISDDPLSNVSEKTKLSEAVIEPTAAQKNTATPRRVLEKVQLDYSHSESQVRVAQPNVVRTYRVNDFPMWSEDGDKFDASILIALIKSKVLPGEWNDDGNKIFSFAETKSLVISATADAHEAIEEVLEGLRHNLKQ